MQCGHVQGTRYKRTHSNILTACICCIRIILIYFFAGRLFTEWYNLNPWKGVLSLQ